MAPRRSSLVLILSLAFTLWVAGPAFLSSPSQSTAPPRAVAGSGAAPVAEMAGAVAPFALIQPAMAAEGDGSISGFEWAGYISLALVLFVFYNAQKASNSGK
uniref:Uncharacterized protein n=1 Tax=Alexandrium catenella TaxID=2925 RepID=A0A7S1S6E1_ALECA|mmetsp:Transcript_88059/g.233796  ORF Transcript_88059/g.233796 Transcript_88059/m.233796 type:complete len:102 (+) Transcript_88059:88-393(+)